MQLSTECNEFKEFLDFPIGTSVVSYNSGYNVSISKSDALTAALLVFDLGWVKQGTRITFDVECKTTATNAYAYIETRTSRPSLITGRKVVGSFAFSGNDWRVGKLSWIAAQDGYISFVIGMPTSSIGISCYRNPRLTFENESFKITRSCNLLRNSSGVWSVDDLSFHNDGISIASQSGDTLSISWPSYNSDKAPTVQISVDTGFSLVSAGFINAGPHTITKDGCKIRLIKTDGTFATVGTAATARLNVSVI